VDFHLDWNLVLWLFIALLNAYTAYMSKRAHDVAVATKEDVATIEKATNSMKDALVASTAAAALAEGHAAGLEQGREERK
jgi:hypothetical protein